MPRAKKSKSQNSNAEESFTSLDVSRITGVSLRQLQWWDEQGVVTPRQRGHRRIYEMPEVIEIALITELRRKGISLQRIRRVLKYLEDELGKTLYDSVRKGGDVHLLTDGESLYIEDNHSNIVDILNNASQPMISVCVSDQIKRLNAAVGLKKGVKPERTAATPARARRAS